MATHLTTTVLDALRGVVILVGELDPTAAPGLALPGVSLYLRQQGDGGALYLKTGPNATDWTATSIGALTQGTADARYLKLAGDGTIDGILTVGDGEELSRLNVNGAAGTVRELRFQTNGVNRWIFRVNNSAETGSNAGSNIQIVGCTDAGVDIGSHLSINRATGGITVPHTTLFGIAVIIGTDPGGADALRVGGAITAGGQVNAATLATTGNAHIGPDIGGTDRLRVDGDVRASGGVTATGLLQGGTLDIAGVADIGGDCVVVGTVTGSDVQATSDRRLKRAIRPITGALARVRKLRPVWHEWIGDDTHAQQASFLAQQVGRAIPWARSIARDRRRTQRLKLLALVAELTAALKESDAQVQAQANLLAAMDRRLAKLERAR